MTERSYQLVLHYDGSAFAGWQRQASVRTVQQVLEDAVSRVCDTRVAVMGAGRTDAGVHARGQAAGVRVGERWEGDRLRKAVNALLPPDVWIAGVHEMRASFHARFSAVARRYEYVVGTDAAARSPFRARWEWAYPRRLDEALLAAETASLLGDHCFAAFAVRGTAPASDPHRCIVRKAVWMPGGEGRLSFWVEANRFLHHMVRFLVGTLLDVASGRRPPGTVATLLAATDNRGVSAPAPPHGLTLARVSYPSDLYLTSE